MNPAQNIYFLLNHPIEYVYLLGPIVAITHLTTQWNTHFTTLELDDGSGSVMEVKITYKKDEKDQTPRAPNNGTSSRHKTREVLELNAQSSGDEAEDDDEDSSREAHATAHAKHSTSTRTLAPHVYTTTVPDLLITSSSTGYTITLNKTPITIGTVLKAKGTLRPFRGALQLQLQRAFIVRSADEELAAWEDYTSFARAVLRTPWTLSDAALREAEREAREERARETRAAARAKRHEKRLREWEGRVREKEERRERRRVREARILDGNALDRPGWKPYVPTGDAEGLVPAARDGDGRRVAGALEGPVQRREGEKEGEDERRVSAPVRTGSSTSTKDIAAVAPPSLQGPANSLPRFIRPAGPTPIDGIWYHELIQQHAEVADQDHNYERPKRPPEAETQGRNVQSRKSLTRDRGGNEKEFLET